MKNILILLLVLIANVAFAQTEQTFPVSESPKGIYLILSDKTINKQTDFNEVRISRSVNGAKPKDLGKPMLVPNKEEFEKIVGKDALLDIAKFFKLENKDRAFNYVQEHPSINDYGILALNLDLGVALGAFYLDKDLSGIKQGDKVTYNVTFIGKESFTTSTTITFGQKPMIEKPKLVQSFVSDSLVDLRWSVSKRNSPNIFFADIYIKEGHPASFIKAGTVFANNKENSDSVIIKWTQPTKKDFAYKFFTLPSTQAGLTGIASDTFTVISISQQAIPQPGNLTSKDTAHGIFLEWQIPEIITTQKAWLLQRTYSQDRDYINLATLDVNTRQFMDNEVVAGEMYYYRIKTITLNHDTIGPSSHTGSRHLSEIISPVAPDNVVLNKTNNGVQITWKKVKMSDVIGYYVYRSHTENNRFDLISELLRDTVYVDKETLYGRNRYTYGVRAYTSSEMMGEMGISPIYMPENNVKPSAPTGAIYYTMPGLVHLAWDDAQWNDNAITGYNIYKKSGTLPATLDLNNPAKIGFEKIGFAERNEFEDNVTGNAKIHYAITSIDFFGQESEIGQILTIETQSVQIPVPDDFYVRKTSKGVVIDWDLPSNSPNIIYTIYKRSAAEKTLLKLTTVPANKLSYTDVNVKTNTLYYYAISATVNNDSSVISDEKFVRY
jgi:hypothetical protein